MAVIETIEGMLGAVRFHYDVSGDVLYLRLVAEAEQATVGEETDDGLILLRNQETDRPVGLTIVNWWERFGKGHLPDSLLELNRHIEQAARRLAA
jgi:hypothetical protein